MHDQEYWAKDGGIFIAENIHGYKLADELDSIAEAEDMHQHVFANYLPIPSDTIPYEALSIRREKLAGMAIVLGSSLFASMVVVELCTKL